MKKGQKIRNVSDVGPGVCGIPAGATYILTRDATENDVFFQDEEGCSRMRPRHRYELVQPDEDKVLRLLKDLAKDLSRLPAGDDFTRGKACVVLDLLREAYGLTVKINPQIDFVPING